MLLWGAMPEIGLEIEPEVAEVVQWLCGGCAENVQRVCVCRGCAEGVQRCW